MNTFLKSLNLKSTPSFFGGLRGMDLEPLRSHFRTRFSPSFFQRRFLFITMKNGGDTEIKKVNCYLDSRQRDIKNIEEISSNRHLPVPASFCTLFASRSRLTSQVSLAMAHLSAAGALFSLTLSQFVELFVEDLDSFSACKKITLRPESDGWLNCIGISGRRYLVGFPSIFPLVFLKTKKTQVPQHCNN